MAAYKITAEEQFGEWVTKLHIGNQHFTISPCGNTEEEAEWMGKMLEKALQRLLEES